MSESTNTDGSDPKPTQGIEQESPWDAELVSMRNVLIGLSILLWAVVIWYAWNQAIARAKFGIVFFGGILELFILTELMDLAGGGRDELLTDLKRTYGPDNRIEATLLTVSAVDVAITCTYLLLNFQALYVTRQGRAFQHEIYMAAAFTLVIIYLTWRAFGPTFLSIILLGIAYGRWGMFAPGPLAHAGIGWDRLMRILVISIDGFFGFLTQLVAAWIALFMLYAGFLKAYGAFDLIMRLAIRSAEYIDSGIAQTAVLSSAVIGSVNGSQTANAGMTGSFTIPLMKRNGIRSETAGAIEAVASTSGQVLPPVMGAGAFIMASLITGISYADVIIAGLIPAAILMVTIFLAVHYISVPQLGKTDTENLIQDPMPRVEFLIECLKYGIPLGILIYRLGIEQVTVMTAALSTALAMLLTGTLIPLIQAATGASDKSIEGSARRSVWETLDGAREGVVVLAPVAIILGAINGVVDILNATGVPTSLSLTLMELSGGVLLIAAILAMIICILLGLGMPTTASYTIVALLIAPTLINQFFLPELASHFFVFYAAILAGLTPPIATCVAVTCGISGGDFWKSCWEAIKISAPLFVLPFSFIYHPEIVSGTFNTQVLTSGAFAMVGAIVMIHGINYSFGFKEIITLPTRIAFAMTGIVIMVHSSQTVQVIAVAIAITMYVVQIVIGKPKPITFIRSLLGSTGQTRPQTDEVDRE